MGYFVLKKIVEIEYLWGTSNGFLQKIEECFNKQKTIFCYKIPSKPFSISIEQVTPLFNQHWFNQITNSLDNEEEENEEDSEYSEDEEIEEEIKQINTDKIFTSDECVISLTNPPNVLFCNCGHLCICVECDKTKSLKNCPICKIESKIKKFIDLKKYGIY